MISLYFDIKPKAKQSFRTTRSGRKYLDKSVIAYRDAIRMMAGAQMRGVDLCAGEVYVEVVFAFRRPQSLLKAQRDAIGSGLLELPKTTKPDVDNLCKALLDALNGIAWIDDAQVCEIWAKKVWAASDHIAVVISGNPYRC